MSKPEPTDHPLASVFDAVIQQATKGKGVRHGGDFTPFMEQEWVHRAKMHGRGFLTGQAAKKLEEAAHGRSGEAFETEMLGAIVYCAMAVLYERQETKADDDYEKKFFNLSGTAGSPARSGGYENQENEVFEVSITGEEEILEVSENFGRRAPNKVGLKREHQRLRDAVDSAKISTPPRDPRSVQQYTGPDEG